MYVPHLMFDFEYELLIMKQVYKLIWIRFTEQKKETKLNLSILC